jgi:uncharacterized protein
VAAKSGNKVRHIPNRTCVGCREVNPKRALIRIVRTPEGVFVDLTSKMNGRGAYLHNHITCWEKGLKGPLASALRTEITEEDRQRLTSFAATLKPAPVSDQELHSENPKDPA